MYDTIHFWIDRTEVGNIDDVVFKLQDVTESVKYETGEVRMKGNLENLKASVSMAGISIQGSLARYYFPDNTYTLNRHQVKTAIEMLSDNLSLPMDRARVTRIDVSTNFIMIHPTRQYFEMLGMCRYFHRVLATDNTLYYHARGLDNKRTMCFYDKARETKVKKKTLPNVFVDSNLLRYESRWNRRLPQQFKEPRVIGESLYDSRFYKKTIQSWADNYFNIQKKRKLRFDAMQNIKNVTDAMNYLTAFAIGRLPPDEVQELLDELKANKVFSDAKYYTRLRQKIKKLTTDNNIMESDELVKELDGEIKNVLAYMR